MEERREGVHYLGWCKGGIKWGEQGKEANLGNVLGTKKKKLKIENSTTSAAMTGEWQADGKHQVLPEHPLNAQRAVTAGEPGLQRESSLTSTYWSLYPHFQHLSDGILLPQVPLSLSLRSPWCFGTTVLALWACTSTPLGPTCECKKVLVVATGMQHKMR